MSGTLHSCLRYPLTLSESDQILLTKSVFQEDHRKKYILHRDAQRAAERRKATKGKLQEEAKKAAAKAAEVSAPYVKVGVNYVAGKINEFVDKVAVLAKDEGDGADGEAVAGRKQLQRAGNEAA